MPLSEHEQRQFDEIERALYADDPKFANKLRVSDPRRAGKKVFVTGAVIVVVGIGILVSGAVVANWYVGLLGFLVMLAGATRAYAGFRRWIAPEARAADAPVPLPRRRFGRGGRRNGRGTGRARRSDAGGRTHFVEMMEERWRRRMGHDY